MTKIRLAIAWLILNIILTSAIDLKLPISDNKIVGVQVRNYGLIVDNKLTKVYEANDGDIIESVLWRKKVFYKPKKGYNAVARKVYVDISTKYILVSVESVYMGWMDVKHYMVKGEKPKKIEYGEFLKMLSTNKDY